MTWKFAKKLSNPGMHYNKAITRPGTDPTQGPITRPSRPYPRNWHIITSWKHTNQQKVAIYTFMHANEKNEKWNEQYLAIQEIQL